MLRTAALLALAVLGVACGGAEETDAAPSGTSVGLLVEVTQYGLTLEPQDGGAAETYSIRPVDRPRLDLFHLAEHQRQREPVRVVWEEEDGIRYAERVDDT